MTATLLPNAKQQFLDSNGRPLAGGQVYFYIPNTSTFKNTWQDAGQTTLNTNPVVLDANGQAIIYGSGQYRQVVYDVHGNLIWDKLTSSPVTAADLSSTTDATNGAGAIGFNYSLSYAAGTIGKWLKDLANSAGSSFIGFLQAGIGAVLRTVLDKLLDQVSVFDFMTAAQIADVKGFTYAVDVTVAVQAAINSGASRIHAPKGGYSISTLDLRGKYIVLYGDGIGNTVFTCNTAATTAMFNANEAADVRVSPLVLRDMSLDGGGNAVSCLDVRYRHLVNLENVYFAGATAQNIKAKDSWLMRASQCLSEGAPIGLWLVGSNHRSKFDSFSFQGNTTWQVKIEKNGTAADGNMAIEFDNCDIEFGTGGGVYIDATDVALNSCYTGENIDGPVLQVQSGAVLVQGGSLFFGHTVSAFGIVANGGKTLLRKVGISGQLNPGFGTLLSGTSTNAVRFEDCIGNTTIGGDPVIVGDLLDYGPQTVVYAKRLGKSFAANGLNVTFTNSLVGSGNSRKISCDSVTGSPAIIQLQSGLINNADWMDGSPAYLVLVYESSKALSVRLAGATFGGAPTTVVGFPGAATTGKATYIKFDFPLVSGAFNIIEIYIEGCVVGDFITVHEFFLADARTLNKGSANWGNLFKC
jgi:hypothetical protein